MTNTDRTRIADTKGRLDAALGQARRISTALYELVVTRYGASDERAIVTFRIDETLRDLLDLLDAAELT